MAASPGSLRRQFVTLASLVALLFSAFSLASLDVAQAGNTSCGSITFSEQANGNATATNCSRTQSTRTGTRLVANCRFTPFNQFSPWADGTFSGVNFSTGSCSRGANGAGFAYR